MSRVCGVTLYENAARAVNTVHDDEQCSTRNILIFILTRKNAHVLKEFVQFVECVSSMNFGSFFHISCWLADEYLVFSMWVFRVPTTIRDQTDLFLIFLCV